MTKRNPDIENEIKAALKYDPATGVITWAAFRPRIKVGSAAGTKHWRCGIYIMVRGKRFSAHDVAWFLTHGRWPNGMIDHINRDVCDNRLENLREATRSERMTNRVWRKKKNNWPRGVSKKRNKWEAAISIEGRTVYLGSFPTADEASAAFNAKAQSLRGEYLPKVSA